MKKEPELLIKCKHYIIVQITIYNISQNKHLTYKSNIKNLKDPNGLCNFIKNLVRGVIGSSSYFQVLLLNFDARFILKY